MNTVKVDLMLRDNTTGAYLQIPVVPAAIPYNDGEAMYDSARILNLGNVDFFSGVDLDGFTLDSFFPGRYDAGYCATSSLKKPVEYRNQFGTWKDTGASLQVICPAAGINKTMTLRTFTWELTGFEGDIYYRAEFREHKTVVPKLLTLGADAKPVDKLIPADRQAVAKQPTPASYTVKKGDTLYHIAKGLGMASWNTLYEKNKGVIGVNPSKIIPGQVLAV